MTRDSNANPSISAPSPDANAAGDTCFTLDRRSFLIGASALAVSSASWAAAAPYPTDRKTLAYAAPEGKDLLLDLYKPQGVDGLLPVILFVHGGGWFAGTRVTGPDFRRFFTEHGFAMASFDYRLVPSVTFPTPVEDVKTAVRWLRANAKEQGLDPARIGLWGTSSGGLLASIAALTPAGTFEGQGNNDQSSAVQCVLDAYGPTDFLAMDAQAEAERPTLQPLHPALVRVSPTSEIRTGNGAPAGGRAAGFTHSDPESPESRLLGAPVMTVPEKARAANPVTYVGANAPPFLIMHGLADNTVAHGQSVMLYEALAAKGNDVTLRLVDGLQHTFFNRNDLDDVAAPFRMDVRVSRGGREQVTEEMGGVFVAAREFFAKHLQRSV
jgi:acetyl esterase/lipase